MTPLPGREEQHGVSERKTIDEGVIGQLTSVNNVLPVCGAVTVGQPGFIIPAFCHDISSSVRPNSSV